MPFCPCAKGRYHERESIKSIYKSTSLNDVSLCRLDGKVVFAKWFKGLREQEIIKSTSLQV